MLKAVAQIEPGETLADARPPGKIELEDVPAEQRLDGAMDAIGESGSLVALTRIYPNEQVTASKFGTTGRAGRADAMPKGMVRDLGQPLRHRPGRRLRLPRLQGRALRQRPDRRSAASDGVRLLLPKVQVIAVAQTTVTTVDDHDRRRAPRRPRRCPDALHPRRRPGGGGEGPVRLHPRRALLRPPQRAVQGQARPAASPSRTCSGDLMPIIVESNTANAELFLSVSGPGATVVPSLDELRRALAETPDEHAIVLGPAVDLEAAAALADNLRVTRPAVSVILMRRRVDTSVLAEALRSGMREVVEERDLTGLGEAIKRAHQVYRAVTGPSIRGRRQPRRARSSPSSRPRAASARPRSRRTSRSPRRPRRRPRLPGRPRPRLRRHRDHPPALPGPHDRRRGRPRERPRLLRARAAAHPAPPGLLHPGRARCSRTPRTRSRRRWSRGSSSILKQNFDYVVVDTSPAFDEHVLQAFDETDELLLVTTLDVPTLKNVKIACETLDLLNFPKPRRHLVLNRADDKVGLAPEKVETTLDMKIAQAIPTSPEVANATNAGEPITASHPKHAVSQALNRLADAVTGVQQRQPPRTPPSSRPAARPSTPKRGLLRRGKVGNDEQSCRPARGRVA